jgi:hypothetical protein
MRDNKKVGAEASIFGITPHHTAHYTTSHFDSCCHQVNHQEVK